MATYFPDLFTGVGFTCTRLERSDFGSILEQNGKTLIKALQFISNFVP